MVRILIRRDEASTLPLKGREGGGEPCVTCPWERVGWLGWLAWNTSHEGGFGGGSLSYEQGIKS